MKVFGAKRARSFSGGVILVAANSLDEAMEIAASNHYWLFEWVDSNNEWAGEKRPDTHLKSDIYPRENWQEFPQLTWLGSEPCEIIEDGHTE